MGRLVDKVAVITGAARGQGAAEARRFAAEGATVVLTDVRDELGAQTAADIGARASYLSLDVTDDGQWKDVVQHATAEFGRIDVLVNNAGIFELGGIDTPLGDWNRVIAVNQTGVFLGMQAVAPIMREQGSGSIINISSVAALMGSPMAMAYTASKWAVRGMTKGAALELAPFGVRANSVHPGMIETPMLDVLGDSRETVLARVPMGRYAEPDEVAELVLFLASDESAYCTGHEFVVDGGMAV